MAATTHLHPHLQLAHLPKEVILTISDALVASPYSRIADLVVAARTCKTLHRILIGLTYRTAIARDTRQLLAADSRHR